MWLITLYNGSIEGYQTVVSPDSPLEILLILNNRSRRYIDNDTLEYNDTKSYHIIHSHKLTEQEIDMFNKEYERDKNVN